MKLYQYTLLKADGTKQTLGTAKKFTIKEMYEILNCDTIELIPKDYYKEDIDKKADCYGDENGRTFTTSDIENPHFKNLGDGFNVIGDILLEEVFKG